MHVYSIALSIALLATSISALPLRHPHSTANSVIARDLHAVASGDPPPADIAQIFNAAETNITLGLPVTGDRSAPKTPFWRIVHPGLPRLSSEFQPLGGPTHLRRRNNPEWPKGRIDAGLRYNQEVVSLYMGTGPNHPPTTTNEAHALHRLFWYLLTYTHQNPREPFVRPKRFELPANPARNQRAVSVQLNPGSNPRGALRIPLLEVMAFLTRLMFVFESKGFAGSIEVGNMWFSTRSLGKMGDLEWWVHDEFRLMGVGKHKGNATGA